MVSFLARVAGKNQPRIEKGCSPMTIFRIFRNQSICLLLLCIFCGLTGFSQQPANCSALKQRYSAAVNAGNGARGNQLVQQLNAQGCHNQPNLPPAPSALHYTVGSVQTVPFSGRGPGEAQSTVLLPGANSACPSGMLLISDDWQRPPQSVVYARDLSGNKPDIVSTFDLMPNSGDYAFPTNDHDLIALANGSVLYLTLGATKAPLGKKPGWWDIAYRPMGKDHTGKDKFFGPGARGVLTVWRSTDCGANFHYISKVDSATMEDGSCAYPRPPLDKYDHYYMGGSDGPLTKLDPADGALYLTFRCEGNEGSTNQKGEWVVNKKIDLDKTLVARSSDNGTSWQSMGFIDGAAWWRTGILSLGKRVAFALSNDVIFAGPSGGKLDFGPAHPLKGKYGGFGWTTSTHNLDPSPDPYIDANIWGNTVIARPGDSQGVLLAFPAVITEGKAGKVRANGYSVFFYDPQESGTYSEMKAISPLTETPENYVMDVTAIDIGSGPVLLYWMDVNTASHKVRMRGRIIVSLGHYSSDFDITDEATLTEKANGHVKGSDTEYFYGDYHTASGYVQERGPALARKNIYHFYPLWVDRNNGASYAVVTVSEDAPLLKGPLPPLQPQLFSVAPEEWKYPPPTVDLNSFRGTMPKVIDAVDVTPK
jgi:hypothetical protein